MAPILIALISFFLRIWNLGTPKGYVFDEVYYVDGAKNLLKYGVEVTGSSPEFIVHPPVGKWCIGLGIKLFGNNEFGWRISSAVVGALCVYIIARITNLLFHSKSLNALAAGLMALDGLALVHSRTALLDLFLTFFALLGAFAWLKNRYWLAGFLFGLASATKWSGAYFLFAFALLALYLDFRNTGWSIRLIAKRVMQFAVVPIATYVFSWIGWFTSPRGWDRHWTDNRETSWGFIPAPLRALWHYHAEMLHFHTTLTDDHAYQANPWSWLVMGRPTSFYYESPKICGAKDCAQEVLALGTPILWWSATLAIAVVIGFWINNHLQSKPDPAGTFILLGIAAGYLPWFLFQKRTVFSFYAIVFEPFLILALVYCAKLYLGLQPWARNRKIIVALFVLAVAVNFFYFLPLFTAKIITYSAWSHMMWWPSWI